WHKVAKLWQTPEVGEQVMEKITPETLAPGLVAAGVPAEDAAEAVRHVDPTMKRSILALYRSGVRVGAEWEHGLAPVGGLGLRAVVSTACGRRRPGPRAGRARRRGRAAPVRDSSPTRSAGTGGSCSGPPKW